MSSLFKGANVLFAGLAFLVWGCQHPDLLVSFEATESYPQSVPARISVKDLDVAPGTAIAVVEGDQRIPGQVDAQGKLVCIPNREISSGDLLKIVITKDTLQPLCTIENNGDAIIAKIGDQQILTYHIATQLPADTLPLYYQRSGFVHPLKSRSGRILTEGFPKGHTHQHGIFHAYTRTHFRGKMIDFWNQHAQLGTVRHKEVENISNGPVYSSFKVGLEQMAFFDSDTIAAVEENWTINIYPLSQDYLIEWIVEQTNPATDTLFIDEYHYGGTAFRGSEHWNIPGGAYDSLVYFLTNEGKTHENGNHSRPTWAAMYGETGNGVAGVAFVGDSGNFRYPQPVRIHPSMPYFCFSPMVLGGYTLSPSEIMSSTYRILVFDGQPDKDYLEVIVKSYRK